MEIRIGNLMITISKRYPGYKDVFKKMKKIIKTKNYSVNERVAAIKETREHFRINYPHMDIADENLSLRGLKEMSDKIFYRS
jgi:hypothetical protein